MKKIRCSNCKSYKFKSKTRTLFSKKRIINMYCKKCNEELII